MTFASRFEAFHDSARQIAGLNDFGDTSYVEPLKLALADYDRYSGFNEFGEKFTSEFIVGQLIGRLIAEQGFKAHSQYANGPCNRPLVIVGQVRSGTTAMLQLLSKDPDCQWLAPWLGAAPMPRPPREEWSSNRWFQMVDQSIQELNARNPAFEQVHPIRADGPDECRFAMQQNFWAPTMVVSATIPTYADWCMKVDPRYALQRYRRVLGVIAGGSQKRWVLKDPSHIWLLDALLDVFPDAHVIYMHRKPTATFASSLNMMYEFRRLLCNQSRERVGLEQGPLWARMQRRSEEVRRQRDNGNFIDVHNDELQRDPVGTAERIYRHFKLPLREETLEAWRAHVASGQSAGRTPKQPRIEDFGLSRNRLMDELGEYYDRYVSLFGDE